MNSRPLLQWLPPHDLSLLSLLQTDQSTLQYKKQKNMLSELANDDNKGGTIQNKK